MTPTSISPTESSPNLAALTRDAGIALVLQIAGLALTYLLQISLARWMGSTEYGIYKYVISWSWLLAIPAGLGFPHTVLRLVSEYRVQQNWGLLRGLVRGSWLLTVLAGSLLCLGGTIVILAIDRYYQFAYVTPLLIGIWMVLLRALVELQLETSRALEDITLAYAPYQVIWPVLVLCGGFVLFEYNHSLTSEPAIAMAILMLLGVVMFQLWLLWERLNQQVEKVTPVYAYREWFSISLPLLLQGAFAVLLFQTDVVIIGLLLGPEEAGIYTAATSTAIWVTFFLQVINTVAAPAFASLNVQNDRQGLQTVVSTTATWIFWPSVAIALILIIFSQPILGVFGSEFIAANLELKVIVIGELVSALCGSVGYILVMTGHQNKSAKVFAYTALINLVLNPIAIITFGILGAAITTALTTILWNIWLSILVFKYVEVNPFVFHRLFSSKENSV